MEYDLVIKSGAVVDGSGLPMTHADVGIRSGVVAGVGRIRAKVGESASRTRSTMGLIRRMGWFLGTSRSGVMIDSTVPWRSALPRMGAPPTGFPCYISTEAPKATFAAPC